MAGDEIEAKKIVYKRNLSQRVPPVSKPNISIAPTIEMIATARMLNTNFLVLYIAHLLNKKDSSIQPSNSSAKSALCVERFLILRRRTSTDCADYTGSSVM
jgi:hypothetical protein